MTVSEKSLKNLRPRAAGTPERAQALAVLRKAAAADMEASIERMSANGLSPAQICMLTGLKADRLYRRYRDSMLRGDARRTNEVAQSAYLMSVGGPEKDWRRADPGMAKFWLERRGGAVWAMRSNEDAGPDLTRLTVPQLIELERALRPLAKNPVMIDGAIEPDAEPRGGGGGTDEAGVGALAAGGVGDVIGGEGEVPG